MKKIVDSGGTRMFFFQGVIKAHCQHQIRYIKFPHTPEEVRQNQHDFMQISGFPPVVGCIDRTHVGLFIVIKGPDENMCTLTER